MIGVPEITVVLLVALLLFGPKKMPEIGRTLGSAMREFKKATREFSASIEDIGEDIEKPGNTKAGDK